jgi:Spy/CpxP family protein refolding chaperone
LGAEHGHASLAEKEESMNEHRMLVWSLPLALLVGACNNTGSATEKPASTAEPAMTEAAAPAAPAIPAPPAEKAERAPAKEGHGDLALTMVHAAGGIDLNDAQKATVDKVEQSLTDSGEPIHAAFKELHGDLEAQVKAGKIDKSKLEPRLAALDTAMQGHVDKEGQALTDLHAALTPAQRKTLVADVRAKMADHETRTAEHGAKGADWQKRKLDHLTTSLSLDDGQQKTVDAFLAKDTTTAAAMEAKHADMKKWKDSMLTSFEGDTFEGKKLVAASPMAKSPREMVERDIQLWSQLVPVLKPEQRDMLATEIEKPGPMMGGAHPSSADEH